MQRNRSVLEWFASAHFLLLTGTGWCSTAGPDTTSSTIDSGSSSPSGLEEIVVSARRVQENQQTVPISITAFSAGQLAAQGIDNIVDVAMATPNLHLAPAIGSNAASISMRGQYQQENLLTVDPSVGVYVDDVYYARDYSILGDLLDVSGVEVLKGPQGTLYGRNTTGGAIKVTTAPADPNGGYTGFADAFYGNYQAVGFSGALNIPLIPETLAIRYAGSYRWHDGYTSSWLVPVDFPTGVATSLTPISRIPTDNENRYTQRVSLRYTPIEAIQVDVVGTVFHANEHGPLNVSPYGDVQNYTLGDATPAVFQNSPQRTADFYAGLTDWLPSSRIDTKSVGSTLRWNISDHITAKAILGYVQASNLSYTNSDGTVTPGLGFINIEVREDQRARQTSEEFQLLGEMFDKRLNWIVGLYNFDEKGHEDELGATYVFDANVSTSGAYDAHNESKSAFGSLIFKATDALRFNAGVRYTEDKKGINSYPRFTYTGVCILTPLPGLETSTTPGGPCSFANTLKSSYPLFDVGIDYQLTSDIFAYVKVNDGYRSGGQQGRIPVGIFPAPFGPEKVMNYEAGIKSELFDHNLRLNLSVFYDRYSNIQETVLIPLPDKSVASLQANKGSAKIDGIEFESVARLGSQFSVNAGLGYTHIVFNDPTVVQPNSPKLTVDIGPQFVQPTPLGRVTMRLDYMYTGPVYYDASLDTPQNNLAGYSLLNGRLGVTLKSNLELSLYGKNLLDKQYYNQEYQAGYTPGLFWGVRQAYVGPPRTYGVEAKYSF
jgi:iron complex outermembrane receptor protein